MTSDCGLVVMVFLCHPVGTEKANRWVPQLKLAILDDYVNAALAMADWQSLPDSIETVVFDHHLGHDEDVVVDALAPFDILVCMRERTPLPASILQRLPNLKLIVTTGMRNLAIDTQLAAERGIPVCGTGMTTYAAAEHSWALLMGLAKNLSAEDRSMKTGGWHLDYAIPLNGRTIGLIGLGKLGSQVARYAQAFEMDVIAWSENLTAERAAECGARRVDRDTLLRTSDYVVIHQVLSDRTRGLIGEAELALMKPTAFLVNTSRGPIVQEQALIKALKARQIAGAGLDVFDVEPLPVEHPYRSLDNALLTGHTGYVVKDGLARAYTEALEDVQAWLNGESVRVINAADRQ